MDIKRKFGQAVRERREKLEIKQLQFGIQVGMSQSYVSLIETGQMNITLETIEQIAIALECEPGDLLPSTKDS